MLAGGADPAVETGPRLEFADDRRQLDRLGPGAEDEEEPHQGRSARAVGQAGRVDDHAPHQFVARDLAKRRVRDEDRDNIGFAHRVHRVAQRDVRQPGESGRKFAQIRVGDQNLTQTLARQLSRDLERRALAQIVDIGLVGQAETGDDRLLQPLGPFADLRDDKSRLVVVDLARGANQPRVAPAPRR